MPPASASKLRCRRDPQTEVPRSATKRVASAQGLFHRNETSEGQWTRKCGSSPLVVVVLLVPAVPSLMLTRVGMTTAPNTTQPTCRVRVSPLVSSSSDEKYFMPLSEKPSGTGTISASKASVTSSLSSPNLSGSDARSSALLCVGNTSTRTRMAFPGSTAISSPSAKRPNRFSTPSVLQRRPILFVSL